MTFGRAQPLAALGQTRRCAGHHCERCAQIVRYRREQGAADTFRLGFDLQRSLRRRLRANAADEPGNDQTYREHDAERQQVLDIVDGEGAARRHEQIVESAHAEHGRNHGRTTRELQRDDHHGEQVHHGDVRQVEARIERQADERAGDGGAGRPGISDPIAIDRHTLTLTQRGHKFPVKNWRRAS